MLTTSLLTVMLESRMRRSYSSSFGSLRNGRDSLVVGRLLGREQQVDARPAVIADDDVVDLVAVQVRELKVADPAIELVELQRQKPEVVGELGFRRLSQRGVFK